MFSRKTLAGEFVGELVGTMILILFGDGVVGAVLLFLGFNSASSSGSGSQSWVLINFGWGFGVMLGVYVAGTLTGAHLNPAVTLALALRRAFPWAKVGWYWLAQVLGAFIAAAILYVEYSTGFNSVEKANHIVRGSLASNATNIFFTYPHTALGGQVVPTGTAVFDEILGTALLVLLIFAVVDLRNSPPAANLAPLIIGLIVVAIGMSFGVDSGYAINPARDFGPRLFAFFAGWGQVAFPGNGVGFSNYFWVPIVAPLIGAAIGAYVYDFTIHKTLEERVAPEPGLVEEGRTIVEDRSAQHVASPESRKPQQ